MELPPGWFHLDLKAATKRSLAWSGEGPAGAVVEDRYRHLKRGTTYRLVGQARVQTDVPLADMDEVTVYRCEQNGDLWARRRDEFEDGRFEQIGGPTLDRFEIGQRVEKWTGEALCEGVVVARYLTTKGKERYVVEVQPQGFQMIAVPSQLRAMP